MKAIADRAEVSLDLPDKLYMGSFTRHSAYEVGADGEQVALRLTHSAGERRTVEVHLHYFLLADILRDLAALLAAHEELDAPHRERLLDAARTLVAALAPRGAATAQATATRDSATALPAGTDPNSASR